MACLIKVTFPLFLRCLYECMHILFSVYLPTYLFISFSLSSYLFLFTSIYQSVLCITTTLSVFRFFFFISTCLSTSRYLPPSIYQSPRSSPAPLPSSPLTQSPQPVTPPLSLPFMWSGDTASPMRSPLLTQLLNIPFSFFTPLTSSFSFSSFFT